MRFLSRSLVALFLLALTAGLLGWAGQITFAALEDRRARDGGGPPARERVLAVDVLQARAERITPVLTAFGEVRARRVLELRAPVGGRVVELAQGFEEGGSVAEGQVLLQVDPAAAEAALAVTRADLAGAEAELRDARRGLELAEAELAGAQAQRALQRRALERQETILQRGVGAAAAVEAAELSLSAAEQTVLTRRGAIAAAQTRIDSAALGLERAGIALREAERDLDDRSPRAAFAGQLSDVSVVQGGLVSANEKLATLIDPSELEVAFRLSAAQHARLLDERGALIGAPMRAMLDVQGLVLAAEGTVTREAPAVGEGQTGRLVFARLGDPQGFRPGDFVRVEVEEPALAAAIRLPSTALSPQNAVLVLGEEDRLEEVDVTLLRRQDDDVLVEGPLDGRDVVAVRGPALGAGIRVRPLRPEADAGDLPEPDMVTLDPETRARLKAAVEGSAGIPGDVKARMLARLDAAEVPAEMVARLEERSGG